MLLYQLIKRYCRDCINIKVFDKNNKIINSIVDSMNIKDIKTDLTLYPNLNDMNISKNIYMYDYTNISSSKFIKNIYIHKNKESDKINNVLIINNIDEYKEIIKNNIENTTNTIILINKNDVDNYKGWTKNIFSNFIILHKDVDNYHNHSDNIKSNIFNYYELMYFTDKILNLKLNIKYFLIKSSCLGCFRNRNHIIFCDTIHICIKHNSKNLIINNKQLFENKNINIEKYDSDNYFILNLKNKAKIKIHLYHINQDKIIIRNNEEKYISLNELGSVKRYSYGPCRVNCLQNPNSYLKRIYGDNVFGGLKHKNLVIKIPKFIYNCYYNQWSSFTSDYWKNKQIEHLYKIYKILTDNNIKCWIDCGTLLGAARNNFIPLFDDDTDIGIMQEDFYKANSILNRNNIQKHININYINNGKIFMEFYNMKTSYNKKENLNYTFTCNNNLLCEFRQYIKINNKYISKKDNIVSNAHRIPGLLQKRAVDCKHFDKLETIKLGCYNFKCPSDYKEYLECSARYGKNSIEGNPIRDCKPGVVVLYDDFM